MRPKAHDPEMVVSFGKYNWREEQRKHFWE